MHLRFSESCLTISTGSLTVGEEELLLKISTNLNINRPNNFGNPLLATYPVLSTGQALATKTK